MKVLIIYSLDDVQSVRKPIRSWSSIQFGISYISSALKEHGHETRLLVLGSNNHWERDNVSLTRAVMEDFAPSLICFTSVWSQYPFIKKTAAYIKKVWPEKFLLAGGIHATLNPTEVIADSFDALCIGEGEYPVLELCDQLEEGGAPPHNIANLWIKSNDGEIEKNGPRDYIQNLDMLPLPDRGMWDPWMEEQVDAEFSVLLGRGCPYSCTYCSNHSLQKIASGKYVRMRTPENIIKELEFIKKEYPANKRIYFEVESIALNKTWLKELCVQLGNFNQTIDNSLSYGCNFRISPQSADENIFASLKQAQFYKINIGLESGSERIRREVLNRNYSNMDFGAAVAMARKYGLQVWIYNIIGLPGETFSDYMETVALNRKCQPDFHLTGIFFPYPGTEIYNMCIQKGFIRNPIDSQMERRQAVIDFPGFTRAQIQKAHTLFNYRVYKGFKPLWWIIIQTIMVTIRSHPAINFMFRSIIQFPILRNVRARLARI